MVSAGLSCCQGLEGSVNHPNHAPNTPSKGAWIHRDMKRFVKIEYV